MLPELEFVYELNADVGPAVDVGETPSGVRRVVDILSGAFSGPRLSGTLVPGGADWQIVRPDGVTELHARYLLRTGEGVLIQVNVRGLRHAPGDALQRIVAGEAVDPSEYYFRIAPVFEAPRGRYEWLNRSLFLGTAERGANRVRILVYRLA